MLVFEERGKPEYPKKSKNKQEQIQPTCGVDAGILTPGHISEGRVLSPLRHP